MGGRTQQHRLYALLLDPTGQRGGVPRGAVPERIRAVCDHEQTRVVVRRALHGVRREQGGVPVRDVLERGVVLRHGGPLPHTPDA